MAKTDKELAVELAAVYIQSWNTSGTTAAMQPKDVKNVIETIYDTIHALPEN